jgi:hypothetical protein
MELTTHIEDGFQRQLHTEVVLVDLSATYDTVWRDGLMLKFMWCSQQYAIKPLLSSVLLKSEQQMASIKQWFTTRQRFSSIMLDLPFSSLNLFQYADDIALTHQARKFEECKIHLEEGFETLSRFFHQWHLCANPSKN